MRFKITIHDADGLPRVWATGDTLSEAMSEANEALDEYYGPQRGGRYIPWTPTTQAWVAVDDVTFVPVDFEARLGFSPDGIRVLAIDAHRLPQFGPKRHTTDAHCTLDVDDQCVVCGVSHGAPCPRCEGRGFHAQDCPSEEKSR